MKRLQAFLCGNSQWSARLWRTEADETKDAQMKHDMTSGEYPARLFIPGPIDVPADALAAQTEPLIGHRSIEMDDLFAYVEEKLKTVFCTDSRVYVFASSGTGMHEACIRNGVRQDGKVLMLTNGAFAERWCDVAVGCGRTVIKAEVPWFEAFEPDWVAEKVSAAKSGGALDAVCLVHNETSTGVLNPLKEIADRIHQLDPDLLFFVDAVSSLAGAEIQVDEWGLDVCLTSSQKALATPPGLAFAAVSDRTLDRATEVQGRGWYFDFLNMEEYLKRGLIPATPAITLFRALVVQLDRIVAEGLQRRWQRHMNLRDHARGMAAALGFEPKVEARCASPTVTTLSGRKGVDINDLIAHLRKSNLILSNGYGPQKGKSIRVGHMGEMMLTDLERLFAAIEHFSQ